MTDDNKEMAKQILDIPFLVQPVNIQQRRDANRYKCFRQILSY